jgi:hypothetical protein
MIAASCAETIGKVWRSSKAGGEGVEVVWEEDEGRLESCFAGGASRAKLGNCDKRLRVLHVTVGISCLKLSLLLLVFLADHQVLSNHYMRMQSFPCAVLSFRMIATRG